MSIECLTCDAAAERGDLCHNCEGLLRWIRGYFAHRPGLAETIVLETHFVQELAVESLDWMCWVLEIEEKFDVVVSDEDAERIQTVADFIRFLRSRHAWWPDDRDIILRPRTSCWSGWNWDVVEIDPPDTLAPDRRFS